MNLDNIDVLLVINHLWRIGWTTMGDTLDVSQQLQLEGSYWLLARRVIAIYYNAHFFANSKYILFQNYVGATLRLAHAEESTNPRLYILLDLCLELNLQVLRPVDKNRLFLPT